MKNNWPVKKLGEVLVEISDGNYSSKYPRSQDFVNLGVPFIRAINFKGGKLSWNDMRYITPEKHAELKKGHLKTHDVLITTRGEIGTIAFVTSEFENANINAQIVRLQADIIKILPLFLFYLLNSQYIKSQFYRITTGSTLKQLSVQNLHLLEVRVPPLSSQKKIVERLDAIRHAQELCDQQIQKTEELFESLSTDEFNQLRDIKNLAEVVDILMGQSPPSNTYNSKGKGLPFFQGKAEFGEVYPRIVKYCSKPQRIAEKDDILLSVRAPVGPVNLAPGQCCIGRGITSLRAKDGFNQMFLYFFMKLNEKKLSEKGFGSTFSAINRVDIERIKIPTTTSLKQQKIVEKLEGVQNYKKLLLKQKSFLKELFDSVLDKSMKGELD